MPTLVTKTEACKMLRLSVPTLQRLIKSGRLVAYKVGRLVRISEESILSMLSESEVTS